MAMAGPVTASILAILLTGGTMFNFSGEIKKSIDGKLLDQADSIELVRINGKLSYIEYKKRPTTPAAYSPTTTPYAVNPLVATPFGNGAHDNGSFSRRKNGHCGLVVDLSRGEQLLNILPFHSITIEGAFSGQWEVALADHARYQSGDNIPIGPLPPAGTAVFDLAPLFDRVDLRRAKFLVFILKSRQGSIDLKKIVFDRTVSPPAPGINGVWLWDSRKVPGQERKVLTDLVTRGLKRVYIQVGNDLESLLPFLQQARKEGVQVFALDGSPEHVINPAPLLQRARAVAAFNRNHAAAPFAGFQIDVEPYTRKDFNVRRDYYCEKYLTLLTSLREICGTGLRLSAVIPFWYDSVPYGKSDLAGQIIGMVDEVAVMSYRTSYGAILEIAADELAYGEKIGKPVYLGVEITHLDDEEHEVLQRSMGKKKGAIGWEENGKYRVKGSDLSFFGRLAELPAVLAESPPFSSFAGWVIHSYEGMGR